MGEAGVTVAFNAAIAARRGLSPRIADLESYGCTIAMGSDNMAEDMVEVLRTGLFMERIRREDGRSPTPEQALRWATRNGYRALGVPDGGWLERRQQGRPDHGRPHAGAHGAGAARRLDLRAPGAGARRRGRHGRRQVADEGRQGAGAWTRQRVLAEAQRVANTAWPRLFAKRRDLKVPDGFSPDALP